MSAVLRIPSSPAVRFLIAGGLNTALTFGIYVGLKTLLNYQISYFISWLCGICMAWFMSSWFVFRSRASLRSFSLRSFLRFPLVYLVQYALGAALLELFAGVLGLSKTWSPLLVITLTLPLTFLMSRFVLARE